MTKEKREFSCDYCEKKCKTKASHKSDLDKTEGWLVGVTTGGSLSCPQCSEIIEAESNVPWDY